MNSIRWRLTIGLCLLCGLLWGAGGVAMYLALRAGLVVEFDQALAANAQALATMSERSEGGIKFDPAGELMPSFERADSPDYYQLFLPSGSVLARSPSLRRGDLPRRSGALDAPEFWNLQLPDGLPGRAAGIRFVPVQDDESPEDPRSRHAEVTLVIARHRADLDHRLHRLATTLLLVGASTIAVTALVVGLVVRGGLRSLSRLAGMAAAIDATTLQLRFPTDEMPAELLPIGQRLNDLLARLEASFARERRFSADVAHELRTPIAELRALTEVSLKWPDDPDAVRSVLEEALAIALQMESVATGLLALTRCEGGLMKVQSEPVRIAPLIHELWQPYADRARSKELAVTMDVPPDVTWLTDPVLLRVVLRNLLSNAVEYSPVAGAIGLGVENGHGRGLLWVSNTTDNLGPDDLSHLFERFWRKDPARSSSIHCGLGLAQTKAYAESLGLDVRASLTGATELTIELSGARCAPRG